MTDDSGYSDDRWWADLGTEHRSSATFSRDGTARTAYEPWEPAASPYAPAAVTRGDAIAYCRWFSIRNQKQLVIPAEAGSRTPASICSSRRSESLRD
jgi:hypothetical protein